MSAAVRPLFRIAGLDGLALAALWLVAATGGVVYREPAPFDVLLAPLILGFVAIGLRVPRGIAPLAILISVFLAGDLVGSGRASDIETAATHSFITLYLGISAVFFACIAAWQPARSVSAILSGTLAAALVACIAGIIGYLSLVPGAHDLFTLYGRARGTFKDPNVFGPFLVLPLLYAGARLITGRTAGAIWWAPVCAVLVAGILLSFSRGAWVHTAISAAVFTLMILTAVPDRGLSRRATLIVILALFALALGLAWGLSYEKVADLFEQRAQLEQSYDRGVFGRFAGQLKAISVIMAEPLGIGSGEFERYHPEQPHNVYLNIFLNAGWAGGFAYLILVLVTMGRSVTLALRSGPVQPLAIALCATFAGLIGEGFFVDTDHWRHFYMIMGLIWGAAAAGDRRNRPGAAVPRGPATPR